MKSANSGFSFGGQADLEYDRSRVDGYAGVFFGLGPIEHE